MSVQIIKQQIKELCQKIGSSEDIDILYLKEMVSQLQEKLTILEYLKNRKQESTTTQDVSSKKTFADNFIDKKEIDSTNISSPSVEQKSEEHPHDETKFINFNKPSTPPLTSKKEETLEEILSGYTDMPIFIEKREDKKEVVKQLYLTNNDIAVQHKLDFIEHLFEGNVSEYLRVFSQINSFRDVEEAINFIQNMVKPDYNWEGKEKYEALFMELINKKYV